MLDNQDHKLPEATENQQTDEVRYSYMVGRDEIVFIRGYYRSPQKFHVNVIFVV